MEQPPPYSPDGQNAPQQGYIQPPNTGYPPQFALQPPQQPGYPPQKEYGRGYPPQNPGYPPPNPGYPPPNPGYPPQEQGYVQQPAGFSSQTNNTTTVVVQARNRYVAGDYAGAMTSAQSARNLAWAAIVCGIILPGLIGIIIWQAT